ncbi:hypothetical protein [Mycolicibacterium aubagnense]|uniref:Integral membrane protein n=1 Tax=Mycolicibacterium aubagnense TaxID=319707 RepID=A0ABM7IM32_9MYCO|nr:hypothetical protein [Mycolicibacterium aubagnense]TLH64238.1 hypothetical protein C1S80_12555 [Mycolicibacterium aubagnense]BBX87877.1 hypothetical protein MAUB_57500 [Mycolicibacterium aubagnense]
MSSFLDLFSATDSDGASAARYRLHFLGSQFHDQESWLWGMGTEGFYVLFKMAVVPANALLGLVFSSGSWLSPLSDAYQSLTAPLFAVFPPLAIACLGLGVVAISVWRSRPRATTSGMFNSETLNRIGLAIAMVVAVLVFTHDPFALMRTVLEHANEFSVGLFAKLSGSSADTTLTAGQALVDSSIRTPTIALNYSNTFSEHCNQLWSDSMTTGTALTEDSGCFVKGQNEAGPDTLATSLIMLVLPALPMLVFGFIAGWKYVVHLTMTALCVLATGWVAAANVHRRRGFDGLATVFAHAAAHLAMTVITSMVAVALPTACAGLATDLLGLATTPQTQAYALMVSLGVGFAASTWVIFRITSNKSALVRMLHADANMTLEKVLGVSSPASRLKYTAHKFNPFAAPPVDSARSAAAGSKPTVLANDPVAATAAAAVSVSRSKGTDGVNISASAADADAVEALSAAAASVADAAKESPSPTASATTRPDPTAPPANRTWQSPVAEPDFTGADMFGYLVYSNGGTSTALSGVTDDKGDAADRPAGTSSAAADSPSPTVPPGQIEPSQHGSVLADPARTAAGAMDDAPAAPVAGNVYADPAIDAVGRNAGATFTTAEPLPFGRRVRSWMRSFTPGPIAAPAPFAAANIQHFAPLTPVAPQAPSSADGTDTGVRDGEPVNDQQRWNQLSRLRNMMQRKPVTSSPAVEELPPSGIGQGDNTHPGSFSAPLPDFLATDALEAEMEDMVTAMAAAGRRISIGLDPDDRRVAVRLSSDPAQRVTRVDGEGFGDPV